LDPSLIALLEKLGAGAGVIVVLILLKLLVPGWTYRDKGREAESWKGLYESERKAHEHTRDAFVLQGERLQVAVESGRVTEQLLREARSRVAPSPAE
jgi:hypothetical protein